MKVLISGDRNWYLDEHIAAITTFILSLPKEDTLIITGGARGVDTIAKAVAIVLGYREKTIYADWDRFGRYAGPVRNQEMLNLNPDLVVCFHNEIVVSRGTRNMYVIAYEQGYNVVNILSSAVVSP